MKRFFLSFAFLLGACLATPAPPTPTNIPPQILIAEQNPYAPALDDVKFARTEIVLTSVNLFQQVEDGRVKVVFNGSMPGNCNALRVKINPPDLQYNIRIEAYSVSDPAQKCERVFQQFEAGVLLGAYSPGRYFIWVNGQFIGDFLAY